MSGNRQLYDTLADFVRECFSFIADSRYPASRIWFHLETDGRSGHRLESLPRPRLRPAVSRAQP